MGSVRPPSSRPWWSRKGRWILLGGIPFCLGWCALPEAEEKSVADLAPAEAVEAAGEALRRARESAASRWAREDLALAEDTYRRGVAELRRQQSRIPFLRDARPALDTLALAAERARDAARAGNRGEGAGRAQAERALAEVAGILELMDEVETRGALPRSGRAELSAARMGFVEASALLGSGAYAEARARAQEVRAHAREAADAAGEAVLRFSDEDRVRTWQRWIDETVAWSRKNEAVAIVVVKERHVLEVYRAGRRISSFPADMGSNNLAQKYRQGDQATPEGRFRVRQIKDKARTRYYRALLLDYPTQEDLKRIQAAKEAGIIPAGAGPGALIEIHGLGGRGENWTNGCVAVTNAHMDELFRLVRVGTPVTIVGGDGSEGSFSSLAERLRGER